MIVASATSSPPASFLGLPVQKFDKLLEIIISIVLSCASLLTAWNGFQASQWSLVQGRNNNQAIGLRVKATQATAIGTQLQQVDLSTFIAWLQATSAKDQALADFYRTRFRAEFKPAFEEWLASEPLSNANAAPSPFALPSYSLAKFQEANDYEAQAGEAAERAQDAAEISRNYVIATLFVATSLFFAGISRSFNIRLMRFVLVVLSTLLLLIGLATAAGLPKI